MKNFYFFLITTITIFTNLYSQTIDATLIELNFADDSNPRNIIENNNKLYFSATDNINGRELWTYDIASNTAKIIKDILPGNHDGLENSNLIFVNDLLFFLANDGVNGNELWRSDGTENGTYMIKNINSSGDSSINNMISYNGKLIFSADDGINGQEIWISDGEESGTHLLKDINLGSNDSDISNIFEFNGLLYFTADNELNGREIWYSDGTSAGTLILKDIGVNENGVPKYNNFIVFDNHFYFLAHEESNSYYDLWKSDGTLPGTVLVKEINQNSLGAIFGAATNDYFVFMVNTFALGKELWVSDGTGTGTSLLKDINPSYGDGISSFNKQFVSSGDKVFFVGNDGVSGRELWATDGTTTGTQLVKDIFPGSESSGILRITSNSGNIIFAAEDDYNDYTSLWKSDGTEAGTFEIKHIDLNKDYGYTMQFVQVNDKFYFQGADKTLNGIEIWETDGTTDNTKLTVDINHRGSSNPQPGGYRRFLTQINDKAIMISNNGLNYNEPFITNGTINGTKMLKDINPDYSSISYNELPDFYFKKVGGNIFFAAGNPSYGSELYKSDGTEANTVLVKDIAPGSASGVVQDFLYFEYNGIFYFRADDQVHGMELWRTDGTEAGTYMLKDIFPGSGDGIIYSNSIYGINYYAVMNGFLYFNAEDGVEKAIWRTDGTQAGTVKVISIPSSGNYDQGPDVINTLNGKLFFSTNPNNSPNPNTSLSVSDGTQENITNLGNWFAYRPFEHTTVYNNELYFMIRDDFGLALMKTNGTLNGTVMVKSGMGHDIVKYMGICGDYLYFVTGDTLLNFELWRTDGTSNGTLLIEDKYLRDFTCIQDKLAYLNDYNPNNLWLTDGSTKSQLDINVLNGDQLNSNELASIEGFSQNKFYFSAITPISGLELYTSDLDNILSVNDYEQNISQLGDSIIIYPNPTKGSLTITSKQNLNLETIEIFDFSGKKIFSKFYNSGSVVSG